MSEIYIYSPQKKFKLASRPREDKEIDRAYDLAKDPNITLEQQKELLVHDVNWINFFLAGNPAINLEIQEVFAHDENVDYRIQLAKNLNLHPDIQKILVQDSYPIRIALSKNESIILEVQEILAHDEYPIREGLAENTSLHPDVQKILVKDKSEYVRNKLNDNPNLDPEVKILLVQEHLGKGKQVSYNPEMHNIDKLRNYVRKDNVLDELESLLPPEKEAQLNLSYKEMMKLLKDPNITPEQQIELARDEDSDVIFYLSLNPSLIPEVQLILAEDINTAVRCNLAENKSITPEIQKILSQDENEVVREILAENPSIAPETQEILTRDESETVKYFLSLNPSITPEVQKILFQSKNEAIINSLSKNINLIPELKEILVKEYLGKGKQVSYDKKFHNIDKLRDYVKKDNVLDELEGLLPPEKEAQFNHLRDKEKIIEEKIELAKDPNITLELQKEFAQDKIYQAGGWHKVRVALAQNVHLTQETQELLARSEDLLVRESLAKNPSLHPDIQNILAEDENWHVIDYLASNPSLTSELQKKFARVWFYKSLKPTLAKNPSLLPELQKELSLQDDDYVLACLAKNPNLLPEIRKDIVEYYLAHGDIYSYDKKFHDIDKLRNYVRKDNVLDELEGLLPPEKEAQLNLTYKEKLAKDPNITPEQQKMLAQDESRWVRFYLASNPSLTLEIQKIFLQDKSEFVKSNLARNTSLLPEDQKLLAQYEDEGIRRSLTLNPSITPEVQKILLQDKREEIIIGLSGNTSLDPEVQKILAKDKREGVRTRLSANKSLLSEYQKILVQDKVDGVRYYLAKNPSTIPEFQKLLSQDKNGSVRACLAKNPSLLSEVQEILAQDENKDVKKALSHNPNITPEVKMLLVQKHLEKGQSISYNPEFHKLDKLRDYVKKDNVLDELEGLLPPDKEAISKRDVSVDHLPMQTTVENLQQLHINEENSDENPEVLIIKCEEKKDIFSEFLNSILEFLNLSGLKEEADLIDKFNKTTEPYFLKQAVELTKQSDPVSSHKLKKLLKYFKY